MVKAFFKQDQPLEGALLRDYTVSICTQRSAALLPGSLLSHFHLHLWCIITQNGPGCLKIHCLHSLWLLIDQPSSHLMKNINRACLPYHPDKWKKKNPNKYRPAILVPSLSYWQISPACQVNLAVLGWCL